MMTAARMHTPIAIRGASRFFFVGCIGADRSAGATWLGASVVIGRRREQWRGGRGARLAGAVSAPLAKSGRGGVTRRQMLANDGIGCAAKSPVQKHNRRPTPTGHAPLTSLAATPRWRPVDAARRILLAR